MAHELSIGRDGIAEAFYALTPAWHGLGTVVTKALNSAEAIESARLCWEVLQQDVYQQTQQQTLSGGYDFRPVAGWRLNVRQDTGDALGVVSDRYQVVQNREAFDFCDGLLQDGIIKYESAGAIRGGRIVWLLAQMPERKDEVAEGEHACGEFRLPVAKSTASHHFRVLREAGVIQMTPQGTQFIISLRREDLAGRFPGLLDAVLRASGSR